MDEIRFAVVGAGSAGKAHAQAIEAIPGARVVAIANRTEERGRRLAEAFRAEWEPDWHTAVTRDDADIVCVCTASGTHAEIAVEAAGARKHVIVEKPIDVTLERSDQIVRAAQEAGVRMTCIFQSHAYMKQNV